MSDNDSDHQPGNWAVSGSRQGFHLRRADTDPMDEDSDDLDALYEQVPGILLVQRFTRSVGRVGWFSRLGEPIARQLDDLAHSYLAALGFPDARTAPIESWEDAAAAAESLDWDAAGWEAEEQLRAALMHQALELVSEEDLGLLLAQVNAQAFEAIELGVHEAAALFDNDDPALVDLAIGSAAQICHLAALALLVAEEPDHPFVLKFRLFEAGRWPVGLVGNSFNIF